MSVKFRILLALIGAVLFGSATYVYLSSLRAETTVVVAKREIAARTQITEEMVVLKKVSAKDQQIMLPNAYSSLEQVVGGVAVADILAGEVLRKDPRFVTPRADLPVRLAPNQRLKLSYLIPDGARAVGVSLSAPASVFDRITREDRVDVAVTGESKNGPWSMIVLYSVPVLDIAPSAGNNGSRDVILLLSPQQSLDLLAAQRTGTLALLLNTPSQKPPAQPIAPSTFASLTNSSVPSSASNDQTAQPGKKQ